MKILTNFRDFWVFVFGYRPENENMEITENLSFWVDKVQMDMDLYFDLYFNFLAVKTEINKSNNERLNLINLEWSETLKRQTPRAWLRIWVNHFEADVIWRASQLFLKLHSHNSVLWHFCSISVISEFSYLGIVLKTKTWKSQKIFIFGSTKLKWIWIYFSISISTFWLLTL